MQISIPNGLLVLVHARFVEVLLISTVEFDFPLNVLIVQDSLVERLMRYKYGFGPVLCTSDIQSPILGIALWIISTLLHAKQLTWTQNSKLDLIFGFVLAHSCLFLQLKFGHWIYLDFLYDLV